MSERKTTAWGSLELFFRNGRYGEFPVGVLITNIGTFACRDKWLETMDAGSYEGEFDLDEIGLSGYMTQGPVREQRTFIKAIVNAYRFDNVSDEVEHTDYSTLDDPMFDNDEPVVTEIIPEPAIEPSKPEPAEVLPTWLTDDRDTADNSADDSTDEMVTFIREQLRSVGDTTPWCLGEAIAIPADLGRQDQRQIRNYLMANGYRLADPMTRTWEVKEVVNA